MEKRVFTIDEVAELLCVSKSYIYQLVRENKIPNLKLGKRCLSYNRTKLDETK